MGQDYFILSETDFERLRAFSESFHMALFEYIDSRKVQTPPWEEDKEKQQMQNFNSIYEELDLLSQQNFDF